VGARSYQRLAGEVAERLGLAVAPIEESALDRLLRSNAAAASAAEQEGVSVGRRGGLGRGLAALIPPGEGGDGDRATLAEVPVEAVVPNPRQPREVFDEDELEGLAVSIRDLGVLQPIVVRPLESGGFELIAGERRLRASRLAGLAVVPAVVRHTDDADLLKEALVENIHRVQLNPLEEAAAYQQLLEEFDFTQEELAGKLGKSRPAISNAIRLLGLPSGVQRRVAAGVLSAGTPRRCSRCRPGGPGAARGPDRAGGDVGPRDRGARPPAAARRRGRRARPPPSDGRSWRRASSSCRRTSPTR
jgi:ParB/RepB/Spo0J family partition protein